MQGVERRYFGSFDKPDDNSLAVEHRADPQTGVRRTYIVGYAAKFGTDSLLLGDFIERLAPSAFDIVKAGKDDKGRPLNTRCLFNHDPNHLLGRFPTTMKMTVDKIGLRYECLLPESRKDVEEMISRGDLRGSSFSFVCAEGGERWSNEDGQSIRTVTKIKALLDVSPVTYPAYDDATVAIAKRSYEVFSSEKKQAVEVRSNVASEIEKTRAFLDERRGFCATGPGGGIDNTCGSKTSMPGDGSATSYGASVGALIGANVGLVAGLPGVLAGAAVGGLFGAVVGYVGGSANKKLYESAKQTLGVTEKGIVAASNSMKPSGNRHASVVILDSQSIAIMGPSNDVAVISAGKAVNPSDTSKSSLHYIPIGNDDPGKTAVSLAKSAGVKSVSSEAKNDAQVKSLENAGFKKITERGTLSSAIYWKKVSSSKSSRSYEDLMKFFESRAFCSTGQGNGIDNSCGAKTMSAPDKDGGGGKALDANDPVAVKAFLEEMARETGKDISGRPVAQKSVNTAVGGKAPAAPSDAPKSLEQQRLEAAGLWDDKIDPAVNAPYDDMGHGGYVLDLQREVTIPGTNQKTKINVDDPDQVKEYITLAAKTAGQTTDEFMKSNRFGGTLMKLTPHDKVKLFGGANHQYAHKGSRSGGWGNKEYDEAAKRIGSTLRAAGVDPQKLSHAVREYAKANKLDPKNEMYSGLRTYQRDPREFMQWAYKRLDHYGQGYRSNYEELMKFFESRGFCPTGKDGGVDNSCGGGVNVGKQPPGKYMEWSKGKDKEAQDFIDKARKDQTLSAGKDGGKSDDGGGVQTWSKGDHFPWTVKQVGDEDGHVQGQHPDGSKTEKYPFKDGKTSDALKKVSDEIKRRKDSRADQVVADTLKFLMDRRV
jgi:HK97 family phage prohead protease